MRNWLYIKAEQFKKAGFIGNGISVAISTVTAKAHSTISWVANLAAITTNSVYSIFKNAETAAAIVNQQKEIAATVVCDSLFFRTFEYYEFVKCKEQIRKNCEDLELEISTAEQKIETLKNERKNLRRERNIVHQKQNELAEKCTSLDIRPYENLDTAQTRSLITKAIQELKIKGTTVEDCLYYIEVKRRYQTLGAAITNLESEIENVNVDLAREKAKLEELRAKHGKLTEEDGHFAEVVRDNDKFESMKRSFA